MKKGNNNISNSESENDMKQSPEVSVMHSIVNMRKAQNITQKELSKRTGINQADISKFENGSRIPSLKLLQRLAQSIDMEIKIELIHKNK